MSNDSQNKLREHSSTEYTDGILFPNTNRRDAEAPAFVGRMFVDGKRVNVVGWPQKNGNIVLKIKR